LRRGCVAGLALSDVERDTLGGESSACAWRMRQGYGAFDRGDMEVLLVIGSDSDVALRTATDQARGALRNRPWRRLPRARGRRRPRSPRPDSHDADSPEAVALAHRLVLVYALPRHACRRGVRVLRPVLNLGG